MNFKRAIVTGGAGFIGSHLVDTLMSLDIEVAVVDNLRSGRQSNIEHHFNSSKFLFENEDIRSERIHNLFRIFRPEIVFHLAAIPGVSYSVKEPVESNNTNIQGLINLLDLSRKFDLRKFIFSSSSSVYGGAESLPTSEDSILQPKSPYALQKKMGEEYCRFFSEHYDLDTVCLRYFNVFGPRSYGDSPYAAVIPAFANAIKIGKSPEIYGDGKQSRDFCFVDNVVSANILAASYEDRLNGESFNVGCGGNISINELHKTMRAPTAKYLEAREGDVKQSCADITKISDILGYKVLVSFEEGISRTLNWYSNEI